MSEDQEPEVRQKPKAVAFSEFLESIPPSIVTNISDLAGHQFGALSSCDVVLRPEIQLHCSADACNGTRFFRCIDDVSISISESKYEFFYLEYRCSNCQKGVKTFALAAMMDEGAYSGRCYKFGELPTYGPPTPSRLITLIGPDREVFLKGRRCENQGLGIGAYVYYRRVIENQKNRILDQIIKVSEKVGADARITRTLEAAKAETQFNKALASVKDAMPQALLIDGHNPLTLLHSALSEGLHGQTDEHCLEMASSVRVVLAELSERLAQALKDEVELKNALAKLMGKKDKS